ncbi:class I SAM-dependent methyltransferase [Marimonas arenosa]|uniref:Class I SAM-dependent methyltransferase n=1 Tax=Marimonas arenosa TaxID=1795305 RepID=A0AAE4B350_9RHOB|nr:class I SAM-dependent methyltransferase [Marimonas arenosa]MDQ2089673.1 class I SAM-dependent methyltransferase [Marimonas arenosa]
MRIRSLLRRGKTFVIECFENIYRKFEKRAFSRGSVLKNIPRYSDRLGGLGTITYGEWCYTVGVFQSILFLHKPDVETPLNILDVGCGTGRLFLSSSSFMKDSDTYTGLDVGKASIEICRRHYSDSRVNFVYYEASNASYAPEATRSVVEWPLGKQKFNLITALSVWTHLNEEDWVGYLRQVAGRLELGGRAVISFFVLDDLYRETLSKRGPEVSRYYPQPKSRWIFEKKAYGSSEWFCPIWADPPEAAIAVTEDAFKREMQNAGLKIVKFYPGNWKEVPGLFFQDIAVLEKA